MSCSIELRRVKFRYLRGVPVLGGVDLRVPSGITLVLGPNGSGKSTLLKLAAGVEKPDGGQIEINGHDLWEAEVAARRDLAYLPEAPDLTPYASIIEILRLVSRLRDEPLTAADEVLSAVGLGDLRQRSVRELSKGQRRRALIAAAWIGRPRVLLLDEPLDAMDLPMRDRIREWLAECRRTGGLALVVTHEIEPFAELADRAVALDSGNVRLVDDLPRDSRSRLQLLERLAAGDPPIPRTS